MVGGPTNNGDTSIVQVPLEELAVRKKRWGKGILIYALREGRVQLKDYVDEEKKQMELD